MPVGKPTDDGTLERGSRHYSGRATLGVLPQWTCPSCQVVHETAAEPIEQGCTSCGAGMPGVAAPVAPVAAPRGADVAAGSRVQPLPPVAPAVPERRPVESTTLDPGAQTVIRVIHYTGTTAWLETTLRRSLVGYMDLGEGRITATIVDDLSTRQQDLLNMARRQPGVWLGQPTASAEFPGRPTWSVPIQRDEALKILERQRTSPVTPMKETRLMADPIPSTGPTPTADQQHLASLIHNATGNLGAYTLAMALNQFATVVEDESMERDKYWSPQQCLGVANALLQLVPEDWQPEPPAEEIPPPAPPMMGDV